MKQITVSTTNKDGTSSSTTVPMSRVRALQEWDRTKASTAGAGAMGAALAICYILTGGNVPNWLFLAVCALVPLLNLGIGLFSTWSETRNKEDEE